jgi:uncharacterized membrane protein YecN with MAPEG domain
LVPITGFYAALAAILIAVLSLNVGRTRVSSGIMIGDGGNVGLQGATRAHGNAVEYLPIGLFLMLCLELEHGSIILLHLIGMLLIASRLLHAAGLLLTTESSRPRLIGYLVTILAILVAAVALLIQISLYPGALAIPH